MVKAAGKKQSNVDIQRIQQIARESRSETLARLQASAEGPVSYTHLTLPTK